MIWKSEWFKSRKVPGVKYRLQYVGLPLGGRWSIEMSGVRLDGEQADNVVTVTREAADEVGVTFVIVDRVEG